MNIADELFEELKVEQEKPFTKVRPPSLGQVQINEHCAVLMSLDTAQVICDSEEVRNKFREAILKSLKEGGKHED